MSDVIFYTKLPDLDSFIKELDLLDDDVNSSVRNAMHEGADIILAEQKRLADGTGVPFLSEHIREGQIYTNRKGKLSITSGYMSEAFETDAEGKKPGIIGLTYEFGRPGKSPARSGKKDSLGRTKGAIQPRPHVRSGFDNKVGEAVKTVIESVEDTIGRKMK